MSDLISKQNLLKLFNNLRDEHETNAISYNALYEVILQQPTIETVPVEDIAEHDREIRNRAIDEFVTMAYRKLGMSNNDLYCTDVIDEIAKQLKR